MWSRGDSETSGWMVPAPAAPAPSASRESSTSAASRHSSPGRQPPAPRSHETEAEHEESPAGHAMSTIWSDQEISEHPEMTSPLSAVGQPLGFPASGVSYLDAMPDDFPSQGPSAASSRDQHSSLLPESGTVRQVSPSKFELGPSSGQAVEGLALLDAPEVGNNPFHSSSAPAPTPRDIPIHDGSALAASPATDTMVPSRSRISDSSDAGMTVPAPNHTGSAPATEQHNANLPPAATEAEVFLPQVSAASDTTICGESCMPWISKLAPINRAIFDNTASNLSAADAHPARSSRRLERGWTVPTDECNHAEIERDDNSRVDRGIAAMPLPDHRDEDREPAASSSRSNFRQAIGDRHNFLKQGAAQLVTKYTRGVPARRPCLCTCCGILLVGALCGVGIGLLGIEVETDFDSFMKTDVNSSSMRDAFQAALSSRGDERRRLQGALLYVNFDIFVAYELKEGSNARLFDPPIVAEIVKFEKALTSMPEWTAYCETTLPKEKSYCTTGLSAANYIQPTLDVDIDSVVPKMMTFDGGGRDQVPTETTIQMLETFELARILLPRDFDPKTPQTTSALRSVFRFKFFCCESSDPSSYQKSTSSEMISVYTDFAKNALMPFFQKYAHGTEDWEALPFNIYFQGSKLKDMEVMATLQGDVKLAGGSLVFVLLYIAIHTQSIFLGITGLLLVLLAIPLAYVVFAVLAGTNTMSIASFLSLFLVIGLGSDVIFVYTDFWRDSIQYHTDITDRMLWTQKNAGKASLATSATTALSFFANLASVLRPLREFGFFMGLCVIIVWVLVTFLFLPLCIVDERVFKSESSRCGAASGRSMSISTLLVTWETVLVRWKKTCLFSVLALVAFSLYFTAANVESDTSGMPNLFPKEHNQGHGTEVMDFFRASAEVFDPHLPFPLTTAEVCRESNFKSATEAACVLFWCEVDEKITVSQGNECNCFRQDYAACPGYAHTHVVHRFVGRNSISEEDLQGNLTASIQRYGDLTVDRAFVVSQKAPMVLEEWLSGDVKYEEVMQVRSLAARKYSNSSCGWKEICFCGTYVCKLPTPAFRKVEQTLSISPQIAPPRTLREDPVFTVPFNQRADISVVFGIKVFPGTPLLGQKDVEAVWEFDEKLQMSQPWAQRNMLQMCTNLPATLRAAETFCWMEDFKKYVVDKGQRFPVHGSKFDGLLMPFLDVSLTGGSSTKQFLWVKDGKAKASFVQIVVDFRKTAEVAAVMEYKELWNNYIKDSNEQASRFSGSAWHTSSLWVRAEAQDQLISSTILTLLIVVLLAFAGMLIFTCDPMLSLLVVIATLGVICGLAFFIICVMQWPIGPVEVIALIVFIGYAVTYSLHITHKYGDAEALHWEPPSANMEMSGRAALRYQRTGFALKSIGAAAMGSAMTTCGCSVFLVCCTLTIFQKLGAVVLAVTLMSILTALGPLSAALLLFGPLDPGHRCLPWSSRSPPLDDSAPDQVMRQVTPPDGRFRDDGPGDAVVPATIVNPQDAQSSSSWKESLHETKPYLHSYASAGCAVPPGSRRAESQAPADTVHIDVLDPNFDIADGEAVRLPAVSSERSSFSSANRRPRTSRIE